MEALLDKPEDPVLLTTFRPGWNSSSRPVRARGIDKCEYVVKGKQAGRQIVNEQIVARLGIAIGAPVGISKIVEIVSELLEEDPEFTYLQTGTAHATLFIEGCSDDRETIQYVRQPENRSRFALLNVLYGWVGSQDQQFIYQKTYPNLVYSVDHGHFFPGGPDWRESDLIQAPDAELDRKLLKICELTSAEISNALSALASVTEEIILQAVASPPEDWQLTMNERLVLMEYLVKRQRALLSALDSTRAL